MSGPIRKLIGLAKSRVQRAIEEANALLETELDVEDLDKEEMDVESLINKLTINISMLERCNKDWTGIMKDLKGEAKATDEKEYARAAEGGEGFIEAIIVGNEVVARLKAKIMFISRKRDKVNREASRVSTLISSQASMIEHAAVQASCAAIQESLSISQMSARPLDTSSSANTAMRLPKLQLPNFDGNILKWPEFWDVFESSVDKQNIAKVSKFSCLKGALRGTAFTAISGIALTNDNYDVVVTLLKQKFGRPDSIVEMPYAKLQHLPTSSPRFGDIKRTHENIESILRQLESQGENVNGQKILIHQILSRFPLDVNLKLEDTKVFGRAWTMELLRQLLSQYVEKQENAQRHFANKGYGSEFKPVRYGENRQNYQNFNRYSSDQNRDTNSSSTSVETFATNVQGKGRFVPNCLNPCVFCQGSHFNDECDQYKELADRKQHLRSQGLCFLCLKTGHIFRDCTLNPKNGCYYCGKKRHHNRAICPQKFGNPPQPPLNGDTQSDDDKEEKPPSVEVLNSTSIQTQTLVSSSERVLLQTAVVPVQSGDKTEIVSVKVLLDSASHRSFMTERLAKQLKLTPQYKESLSVSTFAAKKLQDVSTYVVEFNVMTKDNTCMHFHANVIEKITGPIHRGPLQPADMAFLMSISADRLADSIHDSLEPSTVDLLIGSDYFWSIVGMEKIVLPSGLFLISSKIGYILTGSYLDPMISQKEIPVSSCLVMTQVNCAVPAMNLLSSADDPVTKNLNVEDLWNLETIGIEEPVDITDDDRALEQFNKSVCFENGRYYITWPWKCEHPNLPDNFDVAFSRLKSLARRLERDKDLLIKYNEVFQSQVQQGVIERVVKNSENTLKHYLPHHPVLTPAKNTTKLRVVYDASVKSRK